MIIKVIPNLQKKLEYQNKMKNKIGYWLDEESTNDIDVDSLEDLGIDTEI